MIPDLALMSIEDKTCEGFIPPFDSKIKAAAPETCGQAMDVPLRVAEPEFDPCEAEMMLLPGA